MKFFIVKEPLKIRIRPAVFYEYSPGSILSVKDTKIEKIKDCFLKEEEILTLTLLDETTISIKPNQIVETTLKGRIKDA